MTDPVMKPLFEEIEDEDSIGYELCPLAEPLEFVIDAGRVYASARKRRRSGPAITRRS